MANDRGRSFKTKQVMSLINTSSSSDVSPSLTGLPEEEQDKKAEKDELTVEEKIKQYTAIKRGQVGSKQTKKKPVSDTPKNPILHIPEAAEEEKPKSNKQINAETAALRVASKTVEPPAPAPTPDQPEKTVTVDINKLILSEKLEKALKRFNTCSCDVCCEKISELVLKEVPIKIVTVPESKADETIERYREYTTKQISNAIVKIVMKHKRKPFH